MVSIPVTFSFTGFSFELLCFVDDCYIYGYGSESISGDPTLDLRLAPVKIISYEQCLNELGSYNAPERNSGMFCAVGANPGVDACSVSETIILEFSL